MKHFHMFVLGALLFCGAAHAQSWTRLTQMSTQAAVPDTLDMDFDSLQNVNGRVKVWVRIAYGVPQKRPPAYGDRLVQSERTQVEFDCAQRQLRELRIAYDDQYGKLIMETAKAPGDERWMPVRDDRLSGLEYKHACRGQIAAPDGRAVGSATPADAPGLQQRLNEPLEVRGKNMGARSLVQLLADIVGFNIMAGDALKDKPLSMDERAISVQSLLDRVVQQQGLAQRVLPGDILVIGSPCHLAQAPAVPDDARYAQRFSMNFVQVSAVVATQIITEKMGEPVTVPALNRQQEQLMMRVKDGVAANYLAAIATLQGWVLERDPKQGLQFVANQKLKTCPAQAADSVEASRPSTTAAGAAQTQLCRRRQLDPASRMRCEPLEYFSMEELHLVGFVKPASRMPLAIIAAPDGAYHPVRMGSPIGSNLGRITQVNEQAIVVTERVQDASAQWMEREIRMAY